MLPFVFVFVFDSIGTRPQEVAIMSPRHTIDMSTLKIYIKAHEDAKIYIKAHEHAKNIHKSELRKNAKN